jgi:putative copper export protein
VVHFNKGIILQAVLFLGFLLTLGLVWFEIRAWRRGTNRLTPRQNKLRIASAALMAAVFAMMLAGRWLPQENLILALSYWLFCTGLAILALFISILLMREVGESYLEEKKSMLKELGHGNREDGHDA